MIIKKDKIVLFLFSILLAGICFCIPSNLYANSFIKTVLVYYVSKIEPYQIPQLAKYDVLVLNRFNYDDIQGGTWAALRRINPNINIFLYQAGVDVADNQDNFKAVYLNTIARINNSRGHSIGALSTKQELYLKDKFGNIIRNPNYKNCILFDFGSPLFQQYWVEATLTDIINQKWNAGGVAIDNCTAAGDILSKNPFFGPWPSKYPGPDSWNVHMNLFVNAVTEKMHKNNVQIYANRGNSRTENGYKAWLDLDKMDNPPDIIMDEGAFAVHYGKGDVQFYTEKEWKRQVDLTSNVKHSAIAWLSHTDLAPDEKGIDSYGKPVDFWQILWYSLCSYHLAKDENNMPYFMFSSRPKNDYKNISWFDEYDKIDLGHSLGDYKVKQVSGTNVYWREFEKGYVFVNPTNKDAYNVSLPEKCGQLTHDTLTFAPKDLPQKTKFNLPAHHGAIFLKTSDAALTKSAEDKQNNSLISPPQSITVTLIKTE